MNTDDTNKPKQLELNLSLGEKLRDEGMERAATAEPEGETSREELIELCRETARDLLSRELSEVTIDEVRSKLNLYKGPPNSQNWIGSVFRHKDFEATGKVRKSQLPSNRASLVRVWKFRD